MAELAKRQLYIEIEKLDKDGNREWIKNFENTLNVKFQFEKFIGNIAYGNGKVSICGLDKQTIQALTAVGQLEAEISKRRIIRIKAGYENRKLGQIINATIIAATPTVPPDIWINCDILNNYEARFKNFYNFSTKETMSLTDYVQTVADFLKLTPEIRIKDENILAKNISKQSIANGNIFDIIYSVRSVGVSAYTENGNLIVDYTGEPPKGDERYSNPIEINKDTGMVGLPELHNAGKWATITTLLNPEIKTGDIIKLKSSQIPAADGNYYVIGVTYTGEFRGNAWYSTFVCRRALNG